MKRYDGPPMEESEDGEYVLYEDVKDDLEKLMYLEGHGVDNWEGYDFAMENMRDERGGHRDGKIQLP